MLPQRYEFSSKSQPMLGYMAMLVCCCCYRKGTNFQANHNHLREVQELGIVVVATAKVRIFKQITTRLGNNQGRIELLLLPQRYEFSSKSQPKQLTVVFSVVVVATAKVRIFKQITTIDMVQTIDGGLLLLPQRYEFSSKSQPATSM